MQVSAAGAYGQVGLLMDRRVVGLLVVVLGLLAAVIVPNAIGRAIPGLALAVPVPGPPSVGDCAGQEFDPVWNRVGADPSKYQYPRLVLGDCQQAHYGEVVSVIARPTKPKVAASSDRSSFIDDNNMVVCNQATGHFLGLTDSGGNPALSHDVPRATLTSSCTKLVAQVTKNLNATRDGRLIVDVQVTDRNGTMFTGATIPQGSTMQCGVLATGGRMLKGSLIAIGTEPIPWA